MLKQAREAEAKAAADQPPSGGCVLKLDDWRYRQHRQNQPPSGGCVLKLKKVPPINTVLVPAAFRRLCVETISLQPLRIRLLPAAFRRLCVETIQVLLT